MKINIAHPSNRIAKRFNRSGMTLIEISLVIALLLGLIAVVFLGIGSYRQGADKAKCKMQLAAVQKAVRAGSNFQNLDVGGALVDTDVFGAGLLMNAEPVCPSAGTYTWLAVVPAIGVPYGNCGYTATGVTHVLALTETSDW
ncbi:MAG: type II secretion system protein [Prosthecobacter sp.]|nr:type II secretion system protein [Prosthecobacter sp.]